MAPTGPEDQEDLLPQWAIAVIVMSFVSLLFVILFGVAVVSINYKRRGSLQSNVIQIFHQNFSTTCNSTYHTNIFTAAESTKGC